MFPFWLVATLFIFAADDASAQTMFHGGIASAQRTPTIEVGADLSLFNLMGLTGSGVHVTRNYGKTVALEASVTGAGNTLNTPAHSLVVVSARLQESGSRVGRRRFLTFGVARASGLSYTISPMIGIGGQSLSREVFRTFRFGFRVDLQYFPRGEDLYGRGRLTVGIVGAF